MPRYIGPAPEWAPQELLWIGFPAIPAEWGDAFEPARGEIAAFARAVAESGQHTNLLCNSEADAAIARDLAGDAVEVRVVPLGDVWLRDTGPITTGTGSDRRAQIFRFNGWGGKYLMPGDAELGERLATNHALPVEKRDWVLEGGAVDWDGAGRLVTTEQCLLNPNRNPLMSREDVEQGLRDALGVRDILWLVEGLVADHTDGHVDNLARWVAPGRLLVPQPTGDDDPNTQIYADAHQRAAAAGVDVVTLPSPGRYEVDGEVAPASHMNFAITERLIVVPAYGTGTDDAAVARLAELFPDRRVVALPARALLAGGGSFHCCSMHLPR